MQPHDAKVKMIEIERDLARKGVCIEPSLASLDEEGDAIVSLRTGECIDAPDDEVIELATQWSGLLDLASQAPKSLSDYLVDFRYAQMVKREIREGDRVYNAGSTLQTEPGEYFVKVGLKNRAHSDEIPETIKGQWFLVARPRSGVWHKPGKSSFEIVCDPVSGDATIFVSEYDYPGRHLVGTVSFQDVKDIEADESEMNGQGLRERPRFG